MARTSVATDDFASTTEVDLSGNWTQLNGGLSLIRKASGVAYVSHGNPAAVRWTANSFSDDQYSSLLISTLVSDGSTTKGLGVICRASADTGAGRDYYYCVVCTNNTSGSLWTVTLGKVVNGTDTSLYSEAVTFSTGKAIELECIGTAIRGCIDGVLINASFSVTDSAITTGRPGVGGPGGSGASFHLATSWDAGNVGAAAAGGGPLIRSGLLKGALIRGGRLVG